MLIIDSKNSFGKLYIKKLYFAIFQKIGSFENVYVFLCLDNNSLKAPEMTSYQKSF